MFFFFNLYDSSYGTNSHLKLTASYLLFFKSSCVIIAALVFSIFIGIVLSLPSIFLKIILIYKLIRRNERGQKPVILIFVTRYIPVFVLFLVNISFLLFNFSIAPEILSSFFSKDNFVVRISKKLNHIAFKQEINNFYNYGKEIGAKYPKDSTFIFFLPDKILNNENNYIKTKILISNKNKILITNSNKADIVSSLYHIYPLNYYQLYSPIPFQENTSLLSLLKEKELSENKLLYFGLDLENHYNLYNAYNHTKNKILMTTVKIHS